MTSDSIAELWRYRELLYFFAWREVKVRYRQAGSRAQRGHPLSDFLLHRAAALDILLHRVGAGEQQPGQQRLAPHQGVFPPRASARWDRAGWSSGPRDRVVPAGGADDLLPRADKLGTAVLPPGHFGHDALDHGSEHGDGSGERALP